MNTIHALRELELCSFRLHPDQLDGDPRIEIISKKIFSCSVERIKSLNPSVTEAIIKKAFEEVNTDKQPLLGEYLSLLSIFNLVQENCHTDALLKFSVTQWKDEDLSKMTIKTGLTDDQVLEAIKLIPIDTRGQVKTLTIDLSVSIESIAFITLFPNLISLHLKSLDVIDLSPIQSLDKLDHLEMINCLEVTPDAITNLAPNNSIRKLEIKDSDELRKLPDLKGFSQLEKLDMTGCRRLKEGHFSQLLDRSQFPHLQEVILPKGNQLDLGLKDVSKPLNTLSNSGYNQKMSTQLNKSTEILVMN